MIDEARGVLDGALGQTGLSEHGEGAPASIVIELEEYSDRVAAWGQPAPWATPAGFFP